MVVEMMMEMDALRGTFAYLRDVFPWITLITLLVTIVGVALAEKRRRRLVLERSAEQERIEAMDLDAVEKERLLKAAAPLPESREAYPLPDLPLRLVSALAKVFGLLKIALFIGAAYAMARIAALPDPTWNNEHPILFFILTAVAIALAAAQIVASTKVTRGGNRSRRFLIFMAVLDLGSIAFDGMSFELLWRGVTVALSAYSIWVLLLRKRAQGAVTRDFKPTRLWQKIAIAALCIVSLFGEPLDFSFNTSMNANAQKLEASSSSSLMSGICMPVRRVVLQAGDDAKDTWRLMELVRDALDVPAELVRFGRVPSTEIRGDDMYLLVSKTVDEKLKPPSEKGIDKKLLKMLAEQEPKMAGMFARAPATEYDFKVAFDLRAVFQNNNFARQHKESKTRGMSAPSIRLTQGAEYADKSRGAILADLSAAISKTLNQYIRQRGDKANVGALPEGLVGAAEPMPALEFDFMDGAALEAECRVVGHQLQLYRLGQFNPELLAAVSNQLAAADWKHEWDGRFQKDGALVVVQGAKCYSGQEPLPQLHLVHARSVADDFSKEDRIDLCQNNFADFLAIFPAKSVPAEVLFDAAVAYLDAPDLSATELLRVYELTKHHKWMKALHPGILLRFARMLREEPMSEWTFELYRKLGSAITEDRAEHPEVCDRIAELFVDQIVRLDLRTDANGMDRAEATVDTAGRPVLAIMSKTRDEPSESREFLPFYHLSWMDELEEGTYKGYGATPRGSSTSEGAELEARYVNISDFAAHGADSGSSSFGSYNSMMRDWVDESVRPGDLCVTYDMVPQSNQVHVAVMFNDDRVVVSRAAENDYFLDRERLPSAALVEALQGRWDETGELRITALLAESDRAAFKELLIGLPKHKRTVKYADPPAAE